MLGQGTSLITWVDLRLDTNWIEVAPPEWQNYLDTKKLGYFLGQGWMLFRAEHKARVDLVQPGEIHKRMRFRQNSVIAIGFTMLRYEGADYETTD